ncbi:Coiled-coil protein [Entamoeba marina]
MSHLSKADLRRTFKTYSFGQEKITFKDLHEMLCDIDDDFSRTLEQCEEDFKKFDENGDNMYEFEEAWKLYKYLYPDEEF